MKRILVIEDDESIRKLIAKFLSLHQWECLEAGNGAEAKMMLQREKTDLIICDINLPDMTGNDILTFVKGEQALSSIPFVVISAYTSQPDIDRSMALGANDYITKPFSYRDLVARINKLI